jgi:hypothetical protein
MDATVDDLIAAEGLYLEGFFDDNATCALSSIKFDGGNLGYNSYTVLERLFDKGQSGDGAKVTMTDVNWCPYTKLTEGEIYNPNLHYYKDNGHYGFVEYNLLTLVTSEESYDVNKVYYIKNGEYNYSVYTGGLGGFSTAISNKLYKYDEKQFNADILSELVYYDNGHGGRNNDGSFSSLITNINDASIGMLRMLYESNKFKNFTGQSNPELTGLIYIHNNTEIDEDKIVEL